MSKQAKTLTPAELRRVMDYLATRPHALRNRTMLQVSHLAGCRVGEIAALTYADVVNADGSIKSEIHLDAVQTVILPFLRGLRSSVTRPWPTVVLG